MKTDTIDFQAIIEEQAKERGLSVTIEKIERIYNAGKPWKVRMEIDICGGTWVKTLLCHESDFEEYAGDVLDEYFCVSLPLYRRIAEHHLDNDHKPYQKWVHGTLVLCDYADDDTDMWTYREIDHKTEYVTNNFDPEVYVTEYEKIKAEREAEDEARYETECHLRRTA